jgi:hypothetical protein
VDVEAHVAGVVANDGVGIGSVVVQDLGDGLGGALCSMSLGGCEGVRGDEEGGVDGVPMISWSLVRPVGFSGAETKCTA